jgi:hypothetical protein
MDTEFALWHPDRAPLAVPVAVVKRLPVKVRVLLLSRGDVHNLQLKDVMPESLTPATLAEIQARVPKNRRGRR